jgi:hypothetical protein
MEKVGDIDNVMAGVSMVITSETNTLQKMLPHKIEDQSDIQRIGYLEHRQRLAGFSRFADNVYHTSKRFLLGFDGILNSLSRDIESGVVAKELKKVSADEWSKEITGLKNMHEEMSINVEKISGWVKDEFLISVISFHIKLADNYYGNLNDERIRQNIEHITKNVDKITELVEFKDMSKAAMMVAMEPLLVYGAFLAYQKKDYKYILEYEKAVVDAARQMSKHKPDLIEKYFK